MSDNRQDIDPQETQEWVDAFKNVMDKDGPERAGYLLSKLSMGGHNVSINAGMTLNTPYCNTIAVADEAQIPEIHKIGRKASALIRWNAVAMVLRAGAVAKELGGHIATYSSAATLYDTGFHYFFKGPEFKNGGDLIYFQGHCAPGMYARSFMEGRFSEEQLSFYRQEVGNDGLTSYPHPWLMPNYWQFATVSMGLGPLQAIYQARFLRYLHDREMQDTEDRKVWCFLGDGETDEPESLGAISLAGHEHLDNLIFVINCNLQKLDGPVRGNGKIIQELEGVFRGADWNVIKVVWGGRWDELFAKDRDGLLLKRMQECVDGDYQCYKARDGAFVREHFFNTPELKAMVEHLSDDDVWKLNRGGHDPQKMYAAYHEAVAYKGQPTVILTKTIKGYGMGDSGEAQNITHQQKSMAVDDLKSLRDRLDLPLSDKQVEDVEFYRPDENSEEVQFLKEQRKKLGGSIPQRRINSDQSLSIPPLSDFATLLKGTGEREISSTMAFVRMLTQLIKNKEIGKHVVPIVPDECRTFGMEGLFRQIGLYSSVGQLYEPEDKKSVMYYREDKKGQLLEEGITEPGAFCSWIVAATSYSTSNLPMIPFYIYYSMFGFQRVGDLAWAAGDMQARGFLMGGTAGRTTLAGEGLQHQDGHSHLLARNIPNCLCYDPTFSYEVTVIVHDGLKRMFEKQENIYYYIAIMNENYTHPEMPEGAEDGILKGLYKFREYKGKKDLQLMGSGTILREVIAAAEILEKEYDVGATVWSATSMNELHKEAEKCTRENQLNPTKKAKVPYVTKCLEKAKGPIVCATDYVKAYSEQIRNYVDAPFYALGTDGFGRSDTRKQLRHFFEVDTKHIVYISLVSLYNEGEFSEKDLLAAQKKLGIDPKKSDPLTV